MRGQVTVSKALNRHFEETLGLDIQIEESKFEKSRQPCTYRSLADAADAGEMLHRSMRACHSGQSQVIRPERRLARPQANKGGEDNAVGVFA